MKKVMSWFASILVASCFSTSLLANVAVDSPAPDFTLLDTAGNSVSLSDYQGKYVILEWTNHLCPYVQKHYGSDNMQNLQKKYTGQDVVWLSIISSAPGKQGHVSAAEADQLTRERGASPTALLFDPTGKVGREYDARTTPHMYVIDPDGVLRYAGAIDSIKSANPIDIARADNYLDQAMQALMKGEAVTTKVTVPYGCSVKYAG